MTTSSPLPPHTQDKKGIADYSTEDWQIFEHEVHIPQQGDGVSCGLFACMCADFLSDDLPLHYSQDDMVFFREKICADILRGCLTYPLPAPVEGNGDGSSGPLN